MISLTVVIYIIGMLSAFLYQAIHVSSYGRESRFNDMPDFNMIIWWWIYAAKHLPRALVRSILTAIKS